MGQITKRQHFVPQFLLRNFAPSDEDALHVYDGGNGCIRSSLKPSQVFFKNFLYDRTNDIERILADVEAAAAPVIRKILENPQSMVRDDKESVLRFIMMQIRRTPAACKDSVHSMQLSLRTMLRHYVELNGWPGEETDNVDLDFGDSTPYLGLQTLQGWYDWPLLRDLFPRLLINQTATPFIISDNPAVPYNHHLRNYPHLMQCSVTVHGLQVYLPLTPQHILCLSDENTYFLGNEPAWQVNIDSPSDVEWLNELQLRSRERFVIASTKTQAEEVARACQTIKAGSLTRWISGVSRPTENEDGEPSFRHATWRSQEPMTAQPTFLITRPTAVPASEAATHRDPEVVTLHAEFQAKLMDC